MIAADTNVVIRYLLRDDDAQFAEARELFEAARAGRTTVLIPSVVLCETVWVLRQGRRRSRGEVVLLMTTLVESAGVVAEDPEAVRAALAAYADGGADVADLLIRERSYALGATAVATFDAALLSLDGFVRPRPSKWPYGVAERPRRRRRRAAARLPRAAGTSEGSGVVVVPRQAPAVEERPSARGSRRLRAAALDADPRGSGGGL